MEQQYRRKRMRTFRGRKTENLYRQGIFKGRSHHTLRRSDSLLGCGERDSHTDSTVKADKG